jgi:steroid delta-isomerase-like uncharacterized protein
MTAARVPSPRASALDALAEDWIAAWSTDGAGFERSCTPDVGYEDPVVVEPLEGVDALAAHAGVVRQAFPDMRVERSSPALGRGAFACIPWRLLGTHKGDVATVPATGRFVILQGLHYVEITDGRIRRARGFFDLYDAAVQLGLLPGRGSLGETALLLLRGFGVRRRA